MKTVRRLSTEEKRARLHELAADFEQMGITPAPELRTQGGLAYAITHETTPQTILDSYRRRMNRDPIAYHPAEPDLILLENLT